MKDNDINLPKGWKWVTLDDVTADIYRYPSFYGMEHLSEGIPVIRGEHINEYGDISTDWKDYWFVTPEISSEFPRTVLKKGDIVFTVRGTIGKVAIVKDSHVGAQMSPNLIRISPTADISSDYLSYFLTRLRYDNGQQLDNNSAVIATVKSKDLAALEIPLPPLNIQAEITTKIISQMKLVEKAKNTAIEQLRLINELPSVILREAFEGKL